MFRSVILEMQIVQFLEIMLVAITALFVREISFGRNLVLGYVIENGGRSIGNGNRRLIHGVILRIG